MSREAGSDADALDEGEAVHARHLDVDQDQRVGLVAHDARAPPRPTAATSTS